MKRTLKQLLQYERDDILVVLNHCRTLYSEHMYKEVITRIPDEIWLTIFYHMYDDGPMKLKVALNLREVCTAWLSLVPKINNLIIPCPTMVPKKVFEKNLFEHFPYISTLSMNFYHDLGLGCHTHLHTLALRDDKKGAFSSYIPRLSELNLKTLIIWNIGSYVLNEIIQFAPTTLTRLDIISKTGLVRPFDHLYKLESLTIYTTILSYLSLPNLTQLKTTHRVQQKCFPSFTGHVIINHYYENKRKYVGAFKDGRPHGYGTLFDNGDKIESGQWVNGILNKSD